MFENKFYRHKPEVCLEIVKLIDVMVQAQGLSRKGLKFITFMGPISF